VTAPDRRERLARATLSRISEPGTTAVTKLVAEVGVVEAVERISEDGAGLTTDLLEGLRARLHEGRAEADLASVERAGGRFVCPGDEEWPEALEVLDRVGAPCVGLWARGPHAVAAAVDRAVSVVGSRAATDYGSYVAGEMSAGLADRGWAVVSGGAYGIDAAAHRGALAAGGITVAVLACGVDVAYPRGNASLFQRVAAEGLVISEHPPGCAPQRLRFLVRNRVIAALSAGTVVVEAARRSGAMSTATHAANLGRVVMAVPGPITSVMSSGCHWLLRGSRATVVTSTDEVLELVSPIGDALFCEPVGEIRERDALDPRVQRVLDAVPVRRAVPPESIAACSGLAVGTVTGALVTLQRQGLVEQSDGRWRLRGSAKRVTARG
jgi:DNA processing protein